MESSVIVAYVITSAALLILIAALVLRFLWKISRKWVREIPSTSLARGIFSATHLIPLLILIVCFGYFQPWSTFSGEIDVNTNVKRDIEILEKKADTASGMLPANDKIVISDTVRDAMVNGEKISGAVYNEMHVDLLMFQSLLNFYKKEEDFKTKVNSGSFCNELKNVKDKTVMKTDGIHAALRMINDEGNDFYLRKLKSFLVDGEETNKNELVKGISDMGTYLKTIQTIIKGWKDSFVQLNSIFVTIVVTDISLLCVPSVIVLMYIVFSITIIWTKKETAYNRIILQINQILFFVIAIILIACSIHLLVVYPFACSDDEDKTANFNFDIPTTTGATRNSYQILSTCSSNLFDSPNDDILLRDFRFAKHLKTLIFGKMKELKTTQDSSISMKNKLVSIESNWVLKKMYYEELSKLPEDKCKSSKNLVDGIMKEFNDIVSKTDAYIAALKKREENWNNLEKKIGTAVDKHMKNSGGMIAAQVGKMNNGIKILNVDCQTTRELFSKVNECSNGSPIGFIALKRSIVLFAMSLCMISFLFTYRKFGPTPHQDQTPVLKSSLQKDPGVDNRKKWAESICKLTCKQIRNNFLEWIQDLGVDLKMLRLDKLKGRYRLNTPCLRATRVVLKDKKRFKQGFIHANRVPMPDNTKYIATIAPLDQSEDTLDTKPDFWEMVWQEKVEIVVMLCQFVENGANRCAVYFPQKLKEKLTFGDYTIELVEIKDCKIDGVCWRRLEVTNSKSEKRVVNHLQYVNWPHEGVPEDPNSILDLLAFVKGFASKMPVVVHCVTGVGRTGCFLAIECADQMLKGGCCGLLEVMESLRGMRALAVQRSIQYIFLHASTSYRFSKIGQLFCRLCKVHKGPE
ncbi:unnamed protein product [Caenorhabditis angaria]|uniref:Protein-tyrosine-phosphatase n=1 Tax=Caenorhabditis angaria TaxID=860376 RepID=A0A9P1IN45_9PELO|nr:unnamed protein product [Caenorhabditis angaria]